MFGFQRKKKQQKVMARHKLFLMMVYFHYTNASNLFALDKPTESQKVIVALFFDCLVSHLLGETEPQSTLDAVLAANIVDDTPFFINGTHITTARKLAQVNKDGKALRVVAAAETLLATALVNPERTDLDVLPNLLKDKSLNWWQAKQDQDDMAMKQRENGIRR